MALEDVRSQQLQSETKADDSIKVDVTDEVDFVAYYEQTTGRLVVDPEQAKVEFGEVMASRLKLSPDGLKVLWPQPADDPNDPQNWTDFRKTVHLIIITMSGVVPDFDGGIGIASIFSLAQTYDTTSGIINDRTSNWGIFLLGWGGIFWVMLVRRYGRLPVLFWSQLFALAFLVGATLAPNLATFAGMRCLSGFFGQVTGLYVVTDIFPFHLQARKLNIWTSGFVMSENESFSIWEKHFSLSHRSPFLSPFVFGFLVARASWRWAYAIGSIYNAIVLVLIAFFMEETMYDRHLASKPLQISTGLRYRFETLIGVTGYKMAKYRPRWPEVLLAPLDVAWRPQFFFVVLFEALVFGFSIGVNVGVSVATCSNKLTDFCRRQMLSSWDLLLPSDLTLANMPWLERMRLQLQVFSVYEVAVLLGEIIGRYVNEFIMYLHIRKNGGFFEPESRLWTCYLAMPLYICGFLTLGAGIQHLNKAALIIGWGIAFVAITLNTVAVYAYCNDCFPRRAGEVSALLNFARSVGGFAVAYFQVPWATKSGALTVFGVETAQVISLDALEESDGFYRLVIGLFFIAVPMTQLKGSYFRTRFAL
ncbi:MFS general substrate transporter [Suillus fuscotomentosus]|uniref:MFS general substrate transporter n=1 Tax=Suillus fuscotomentosus TaxID=1912939 RepID=A0AAD4HFV0_9AGAM|nr:MFS general substrate transporter [Suillus fuscotomentosus]KAG1894641.1 MFS general substrate transporter [Suillus fuscotomentosus]